MTESGQLSDFGQLNKCLENGKSNDRPFYRRIWQNQDQWVL